MGKDSEMAVIGAFLKEERKRKKANRLKEAEERSKLTWKKHTRWHWAHETRFGADVEYWPSTTRWIDRGTGKGGFKSIDQIEKYVTERM